ncbi:type II secretion system F family protein [Vibrio hippocampi]|uniref:Type II secretion system protein GspF domain-containing protein n=1 Tax=Vibrio hippocampi TaxID=654686 RepID=A0ABN8DK32_9VIBR|nr:type II secretion system F family protein [Vibrio hippocampi]CAH0529686.1 hypothetical protein VHP8226_03441 [Vibrio hippocampi]
MMLLLAMGLLVCAVLFFIYDALQTDKRKRQIEIYLESPDVSSYVKVNRFLVRFGKGHQKELEGKLVDAGIYNKELAKYYFPMKLILLGAVGAAAVLIPVEFNQKLIIGVVGLVAVIVVPDLILNTRRRSLVRKVTSQLPYLLDMMAVCVQTGMTIEASLAYLADELEVFDQDLCYQIKRISDSAKIKGLEKALNDFGERVPTPPIRSFVLTVVQNLQYGTSISQVLTDLSEDLRKVQILTVEEKVGKLSAKMSVPLIILIMFPIVILILAPGIMQMSLNVGG